MKAAIKLLIGLATLTAVGLLPVIRVEAQTRGAGVGALATKTSGTSTVTVSGGHTAPWSEIIVENEAGDLMATAEIDSQGIFNFTLLTNPANIGHLKIFGVDAAGATSQDSISSDTIADFILAPTIIADTGSLSNTSIGLLGYAYQASEVTVSLVSDQGYNESFQPSVDSISGKWTLTVDNLGVGNYTASTNSTWEDLVSNESQDLTFTIGATPPPGTEASQSGIITQVIEVINETIEPFFYPVSQAVKALPPEAKKIANNTSKALVPVAAASTLFQTGIFHWLMSFDYFTAGMRILFGFFIPMRRKKNRWGIIYDAVTKAPLRQVIVRLFKANGGLVETEATGATGIFSFIPGEGQYEIKVILPDYIFPSNLVKGTSDGEYQSVYHGEIFTVASQNPVVNLSIPMDPKGYEVKSRQVTLRAITSKMASGGTLALYSVGLIFSVISYIANPVFYNTVVLLFYAATCGYLIRSIQFNRNKWGVVVDEKGHAVSGVELSLLDSVFRRLVHRRITDNLGRYQFVVPKGGYYILVASPDWELVPMTAGYSGDVIEVKKGISIIKERIIVRKKPAEGFTSAARDIAPNR